MPERERAGRRRGHEQVQRPARSFGRQLPDRPRPRRRLHLGDGAPLLRLGVGAAHVNRVAGVPRDPEASIGAGRDRRVPDRSVPDPNRSAGRVFPDPEACPGWIPGPIGNVEPGLSETPCDRGLLVWRGGRGAPLVRRAGEILRVARRGRYHARQESVGAEGVRVPPHHDVAARAVRAEACVVGAACRLPRLVRHRRVEPDMG
jgi:hypothetical protein